MDPSQSQTSRVFPLGVNSLPPRNSASFRMRPILFLLFSGLAIIPLLLLPVSSMSVVDRVTGPLVKRNTCSHDFILTAFANACKGKRSEGEKLVESQSGSSKSFSDLEDEEVLQILSNSLNLYESWTQHGKREEEEDTSPTKDDTIKTTPTDRWRKVKNKVKVTSMGRWRGRRVSTADDKFDSTQNEIGTKEENNEVSKSSITTPIQQMEDSSFDTKMWKWVIEELEAKLGAKGGRLQRNHKEVWSQVENCCKTGICKFNC